ncbi:Transcription factor ACEII [Verticillium dahliae VDG2]|nr:Transcription factor ACEII [Verticillium dahliae VDG2]
MTLLRLSAFRVTPNGIYRASVPMRSSVLRPLLHKILHQARSNSTTAASKPTPSSRIPSSSSINKPGTPPIPEHLLIYHAGTSRITFLALWKITSLFLFAFFTLIAAPSYARRASQTPDEAADATTDPQAAQKTYLQAAGLALCGVIPLVYRDVAALEARRAWHQYRPVAQFGVRVANCKGVRDGWVWDAVRPLLGKTARERRA